MKQALQKVIERKIDLIRGERMMLDSDLAELDGVTAKRLNEQVKRNRKRFPKDFIFQLTVREADGMRSHFATAWKRNIRYRPYAFTEYGAFMAANILNSERAISMSVYVLRAFVRMRETLAAHQALEKKLRGNREDSFNARCCAPEPLCENQTASPFTSR